MDATSIPMPHPQVAAQVIDDQAVIVLADAGEVNILNEVGTRVWELCDGKHTVADIIRVIAAEFDAPLETVERDVREFLQELVAARAVTLDARPPN